jgi:hypothetical protein
MVDGSNPSGLTTTPSKHMDFKAAAVIQGAKHARATKGGKARVKIQP